MYEAAITDTHLGYKSGPIKPMAFLNFWPKTPYCWVGVADPCGCMPNDPIPAKIHSIVRESNHGWEIIAGSTTYPQVSADWLVIILNTQNRRILEVGEAGDRVTSGRREYIGVAFLYDGVEWGCLRKNMSKLFFGNGQSEWSFSVHFEQVSPGNKRQSRQNENPPIIMKVYLAIDCSVASLDFLHIPSSLFAFFFPIAFDNFLALLQSLDWLLIMLFPFPIARINMRCFQMFLAGLMLITPGLCALATYEQADAGKVDGFTGQAELMPKYVFLIPHGWVDRHGHTVLILNPYKVATTSRRPSAIANILKGYMKSLAWPTTIK